MPMAPDPPSFAETYARMLALLVRVSADRDLGKAQALAGAIHHFVMRELRALGFIDVPAKNATTAEGETLH